MIRKWTALAGLCLWLCSCDEPLTEIMVVVDTDLAIGTAIDRVHFEIRGPLATTGVLKSQQLTTVQDLPVSLGLQHAGGALGPVLVTVSGTLDGVEVVRRRADLRFVKNKLRMLRMDLLAACLDVECRDENQTCGDEGCRNLLVGAGELVPYKAGIERSLTAVGIGGAAGTPPVGSDGDGGSGGSGGDGGSGGSAGGDGADECDSGLASCDSECTDTSLDLMHCGGCNAPCAPEHATGNCEAGDCSIVSCDSGYADCDGLAGNGCEADLNSAMEHCGQCDQLCSPSAPQVMSAACVAGSCINEACDSGWSDCNGQQADGCEIDTSSDVDNCGSCGMACLRRCCDSICFTTGPQSCL